MITAIVVTITGLYLLMISFWHNADGTVSGILIAKLVPFLLGCYMLFLAAVYYGVLQNVTTI